jgi:AraC-like DNA-binding protein
MQVTRHRLRERWPTLEARGVAVQRFPAFRAAQLTETHFNAHDVLYASFLVEGCCRHDIGDQQFDEQPGSLAVVHYGVPHFIDTGGVPVSLFNIYLDPERHPMPSLPAELRGPLHALLPIHPGLANRRNRLLRCHFDDRKAIGDLLQRMWDEQEAAQPGHLDMLAAQLGELLIHIGRQLAKTGVRGPAEADPAMEHACAWLAGHLAEEVGVQDLAQAVGLSRFHLSRRFLAYTDRTPMAYLMDLRLQEAALRLRGGDESVLGVALACGFKDLGHFGRRFKAMFGRSPARYRDGAPADQDAGTGSQAG